MDIRYAWRRPGRAGRALALFLSAWMAAGCASRPPSPLPALARRGVVDGVGYARIEDGDVARARKQALDAALRDMALSARAVVRARSTYRLFAEDGKPKAESLDDLVEVSAFQVLASRHAREDVDLRSKVYRVYLWLTEEELRESIEQTRLARRALLARARRAYEGAQAEAEKDPASAQKRLRQVLGWVEDAGLQAEAEGAAFHARVESLLRRVEARIREGEGLYVLAEKAFQEGRLKTAALRLEAARKRLPDASRAQGLGERVEEKRRRAAELKREAMNLRSEDKLEEALEAYQGAGAIDREDTGVQEAVTELRAAIAWQKRQRDRKIASAVANFFLVLGAAALVGVAVATGGAVRPYAQTGAWRR